MHLLGIDYGTVYLGLAISRENLPETLAVIKSKSDDHKIAEIVKICREENISKIIIGKGGAKLENRIKGFIKKIKEKITVEIIPVDETLTSSEALDQMIEEGVPRKQRKEKEHSFAAALLLRSYLQEVKN
ncbi:MAG: Holliday junction resolvase RuvX [Patescibacteria group bacterium]|nr:Holliday junction resolvase RuvX [Patescibacteria group bacterium]